MNKRCIVNVATGEFYCKMQDRLINSFEGSVDQITMFYPVLQPMVLTMDSNDTGVDMMLWNNCFPPGSRSHEESPYGFKVHAIKAAYEKGYTSILWLDSPAYAVKEDVSPIFEKIEKEGYYVMSHIDPLENFVGDKALSHYGYTRDEIRGLNLPSGSCYGVCLDNTIGQNIFEEMIDCEKTGLFQNEVIGNVVHRHDEAILALILKLDEQPVFTFDPLFQSDSPQCVIKSGG